MADEKTSPKKAEVRGQMSDVSTIASAPAVAGEGARVPSAADTQHPTPDTLRFRFIENVKGDSIEIANGEYRRVFNRADEPFEVTRQEAEDLRVIARDYLEEVPA